MQRSQIGEFEIRVESNPIDPPFIDYKNQKCVMTQELFILDPNFPPEHHRHEVARAHQFKTEEGTVGASGMPDPKEMMIGDINYRGLKKSNPHCQLCEAAI